MGHYCRVCGRARANERFSGKGHARHVCKDCARLPAELREKIQALRDIHGFLNQRNISAGNIVYLKFLCESSDQEVSEPAALVLEVAKLKPHKRRRMSYLARNVPGLLDRLEQAGLLHEGGGFTKSP